MKELAKLINKLIKLFALGIIIYWLAGVDLPADEQSFGGFLILLFLYVLFVD